MFPVTRRGVKKKSTKAGTSTSLPCLCTHSHLDSKKSIYAMESAVCACLMPLPGRLCLGANVSVSRLPAAYLRANARKSEVGNAAAQEAFYGVTAVACGHMMGVDEQHGMTPGGSLFLTYLQLSSLENMRVVVVDVVISLKRERHLSPQSQAQPCRNIRLIDGACVGVKIP